MIVSMIDGPIQTPPLDWTKKIFQGLTYRDAHTHAHRYGEAYSHHDVPSSGSAASKSSDGDRRRDGDLVDFLGFFLWVNSRFTETMHETPPLPWADKR